VASITKRIGFSLMALTFRVRDAIRPLATALQEAGLESGMVVLDFGCGPGSYSLAAARLVGRRGLVYALDVNPVAVEAVAHRAHRAGFANLQTIHSECASGLAAASVDRVLLYDTFHDLEDPEAVLEELHRVLHSQGLLSVSDHHLTDRAVIAGVTGGGLFAPAGRGQRTFSFAPIASPTIRRW
jgi:ubiquinone/menaquinone biosynthesis C-methylase UbiE